MTFLPAIPLTGLVGWRVFQESAPRQQEVFERQPLVQKNVAHFRENASTALTAADLVADRRLLSVALGAFGLEEEINKRALIRRVLEEGTIERDAFANRLNDKRWRDFAETFGYGDGVGARVLSPAFQESIISRYLERAFEASVGEVDTDMRLASNFRREALEIANGEDVDRVGWFEIMGQRPLRAVMEAALGLPTSIGTADIDQQRDLFADKFQNVFGVDSLSALRDPDVMDAVLQRFFLQSELQNGPSASTPGAAALSILSGPSSNSLQAANLFNSNLI
ncbi:MAG: DUF1217 domain-containing protein [Pseudomonadota bacterium]